MALSEISQLDLQKEESLLKTVDEVLVEKDFSNLQSPYSSKWLQNVSSINFTK